MKKFRKYFICLLIVFGLFSIVVYADMNLKIKYVNNYDDVDVYDVDVLVDTNKFNLNNLQPVDYELPDGFMLTKVCGIKKNDNGIDEMIDKETCQKSKEEGGYGGIYYGYGIVYGANTSIVYVNTSNIFGGNNGDLKEISGEIVLTFEDAAMLNDGTYADIVMTIDNIRMKLDTANGNPALILKQGESSMSVGADSPFDGGFSGSYDMAFELRKGSKKISNLTMGIIFSDLDVYHDKYPESIQLIWGIKDTNLYRLTIDNPNVNLPDSHKKVEDYLIVSNNNTKYTTTELNTNVGGLSDSASERAGFAVKVKSNGFKYNWTGTECGTDIRFLTTNPSTGNVSNVILVFVLLVLSGAVMFIFLRKFTKIN